MSNKTPKELRKEALDLYFGNGCEPDEARATELFRQAAAGRDAVAAAVLGCMPTDDLKAGREWLQASFRYFDEAGKPEEDKDYIAAAHDLLGRHFFFNWEDQPEAMADFRMGMALLEFMAADEMGNHNSRNLLGYLVYTGVSNFVQASTDKALEIWKQGMDEGDQQCALRYCTHFVENHEADEEVVNTLLKLVDEGCADACALLSLHFAYEGEEELAEDYRERGLEMGSEMMQSLEEEEREQEAGEDGWTAGERCVIVVDTDGDFRIVPADATEWESLPPLIGADRTDNMRCNKLREVSRQLGLKGTLLALLDRDAFRKPDLEPNYRASQWYDGMADLYGDMLICLEDASCNPFSFASEAEARRVADALR